MVTLRCQPGFCGSQLAFYNVRHKTQRFYSDRVKMPLNNENSGICTEMARPREFDEQAVLDTATEHFWVNGYEATSMRDLAEGTGLTSPSLYNAFGDKRALYRLVLDRYVQSALVNCTEIFEGNAQPLQAIERYIDAIIAEALDDRLHKGCFVVNTALEVAPHDAEFREVVTDVFGRIERYLRDSIAAGQSDGSILTGQSAADLARLFLGASLGVRVLARTSPDRALLKGLARPLFALLRKP
jgi:TetR/AcrR family transcriptional repressor of nem operon